MDSQNAIGGEKSVLDFVSHHFKLVRPGAKHSVDIEGFVKNSYANIKKQNKNMKPTKEEEARYLDAFAAAYIMHNMTDLSSDLFFEPYVNGTKSKYDRKDPAAKYLNINKKMNIAANDFPPALLEYDAEKIRNGGKLRDERKDLSYYDRYTAVFNGGKPIAAPANKTISKMTPAKVIDKMKKNGWNIDDKVTNVVNAIFDVYEPEKNNSAALSAMINKLTTSRVDIKDYVGNFERTKMVGDAGLTAKAEIFGELRNIINAHRLEKSSRALLDIIDRTRDDFTIPLADMRLTHQMFTLRNVSMGRGIKRIGRTDYKSYQDVNNMEFHSGYNEFITRPGGDVLLRQTFRVADNHDFNKEVLEENFKRLRASLDGEYDEKGL